MVQELVGDLSTNFVGSYYDNTINWWVAQVEISNIPSALPEALGCLGSGIMSAGIVGTFPSLSSIVNDLKGC
jgi:hypothetical protein